MQSTETSESGPQPTSPNKVSTMSQYSFTPTQDWFSSNADTWRAIFSHVVSSAPRVLEIGSWEGRSAVFLLTELCSQGGSITCIDHFDLMNTQAGRERNARLTHNLTQTGKPFRIVGEFSFPALMMLLQEEISATDPGFDWVYVDGSHEADDTFLDGELAWRLAKKGAVFIFDDYHWDREPAESVHHPKRGIDSFMALHANQFEVLSAPTQYQMILRKKADMRIGFLTKETANPSAAAFGYGIHVALTIDSAYAMPAAVTIQSTISHTKGRISFYVVDLGLSIEDKKKIQILLEGHEDVTLQYLCLPQTGLVAEMGPVWAKVAMIEILPVERVLYLDADVLVRKDLQELWDTDLQGKSIGASVDVGHPMGHSDVERHAYFNAGVMLMDLTKIRGRLAELKRVAGEFRGSSYLDQDALNIHFRDDWHPLSLEWNAQGLGTYAKYPTDDRKKLDLDQMDDPAVVHFTGPVNPPVVDVLNKWVQPYTSKPWGYAGAPGHPFEAEWWTVVDQTAWRGWRSSEGYSKDRAAAAEDALKVNNASFRKRLSDLGITV